jgi:hypothetical protein
MKFFFSCGVLVHNMRKLYLYRVLQWFISGGRQVYVLMAIGNNKNAEILHTTEHCYVTI